MVNVEQSVIERDIVAEQAYVKWVRDRSEEHPAYFTRMTVFLTGWAAHKVTSHERVKRLEDVLGELTYFVEFGGWRHTSSEPLRKVLVGQAHAALAEQEDAQQGR